MNGRISSPSGITQDPAGNTVFADYGNHRIQRITPQGTVTTIAGAAGTPRAGFSGDGGLAGAALLRHPVGVAYDAAGNLYITDGDNLRIRKVDACSGIITTIAGNGRPGVAGVGAPATQASIVPLGIAADAGGNVYIADMSHRVLKVAAGSGILTMVARTGAAGYTGDGHPATSAQLRIPSAVAVDAAGNLYIADAGNAAVRKVNPSGLISTIAGSGNPFVDTETGPALAVGMFPFGLAVAASGDVYLADLLNDRIRKLSPVVVRSLTIAIGANSTGNPGAKITVSVKAVDTAGNPAAGVQVAFAVTSGTALVAPASALTVADGLASATVTLGDTPGTVSVSATAAGLPAVVFNLTINTVATGPMPQIAEGGVVGAALAPGKHEVAVGEIATIFGQSFAAPGTARTVGTADLVNGKRPNR